MTAGSQPVADALVGGSAAAAATALGAALGWFTHRITQRTQDTLLGFGAGVMLAATAFSLVLPGVEAARALVASPLQAGLLVGAAVLAGALLVLAVDRSIPHEHFIKGVEGRHVERVRRAWLFVFAICLHNIPEGLAIGVGYSSDSASGTILATGISLQNIPEGFVVAAALVAAGYTPARSTLIGMASGLLEPLGAVAGAAFIMVLPMTLPVGLGLAGGAMLYVVSHEVIPESHRQGHEHWATVGLVIGFVLMMLLDTSLR